ncbi:serine/threonine-protein kinase [Virgisporangium aliadipatigenens]|uniref:serine/threonine-protein kinase n=1 Tax=Virgisporangium aliadipatigenens TaxID=741659 RepID=UPI0019420C63|nr:serine/threonine-protein kinase [Virgisporangium aliadipatigenens]
MPHPEQIGRYRIVQRVGTGAFATVWLGADDTLDAQVAIKVLADNWAHHPDVRARFMQEARIMRRADSPRIARILDIDELPDGRPYLVMPYAPGGTLADRLADGPLPVQQALAVGAEIAEAVADLHRIGVLHRDLKPSNVLFDRVAGEDRVVVTDLGLAKSLAHASGFTVVAGTPAYMSPEQAQLGGALDERSDVYAIGAILFHMLTGEVPPARTGNGRPQRPSRFRPGIPAAVDNVVVRAGQADPDSRWPSAAALAEALRALKESDSPSPRRRSRRAWVMAVAAGLVLAGTAGGGVVFWQNHGTTVRVSDATGGLSVAVPAAWAGQLRDAGWDPAVIGLPAGHAPGLVVSSRLSAWSDPRSAVPGVFVGASRSLAGGTVAPTLPEHPECAREPDRTVTVAGVPARVRRWVRCGGTATAFDEVTFEPAQRGFGVYVQLRQVDAKDRTDAVLGSLRIADSLAPQAAAPAVHIQP